MQQNSNSWLCANKGQTIYHMMDECRKLAQREYKTRHDCVGNVIHRELCKKWKGKDRDNPNKRVVKISLKSYYKNDPEYLTKVSTQLFIPLKNVSAAEFGF